ncbi:MAG: RHS repeat-associated core domain-containing protein [Aridibacter famidurans]|nr:RHS repeat-associated core domain-containing protein [Aridibacter famidurans]
MRSPKLPQRFDSGRPAGLLAAILAIVTLSIPVFGQLGNGTSEPSSTDSSNRADTAIKGKARVNPRTLALEFSLPLMSYPGRNGHGLSASLDYSSKVWRMDSGVRWWYETVAGRRYVTDLNARFAERTAAGWTSSLAAPFIEARPNIYYQDGRPFNDPLGSASVMDSIWAEAVATGSSNLMPSENFRCVSYGYYWCPDCVLPDGSVGAHIYHCNGWEIGPGVPEPPEIPIPPDELQQLFYAARVFVSMPGGARHEFRKDDSKHPCGPPDAVCEADLSGTFLSTDGTGMRLERSGEGSVLFLPNGSRYVFPPDSAGNGEGVSASRFVDVNGNTISYSVSGTAPHEVRSVSDTLGRELTDYVPRNGSAQTQTAGTNEASLPWLGGGEKTFGMKWAHLKPQGCENSTDSDCADQEGRRGGALDNQTTRLAYDSRYFCRGSLSDDLDQTDPGNVLFRNVGQGVRPCNAFRTSSGGAIAPSRFNPVVLEEVRLPDGRAYRFKYNRYGEISRIVYPTGVFEEFDHGTIEPVGGTGEAVYDQTNRGVRERRIYNAQGVLQQRWKYTADFEFAPSGRSTYTVAAVVSKPDDALADGARTETEMGAFSGDEGFGFRDPETGSVIEVRRFDESGGLVTRTLFEWTFEQALPGGEPNAKRDLRKARTVELSFEPGSSKALASMTASEYDGSSQGPGYFSHLNTTRSTSWGFAVLDAAAAASIGVDEASDTIAGQAEKRSVIERGFIYDQDYRDIGLTNLVLFERVIDPNGSGGTLNETRFEYDSQDLPYIDPGNAEGWADPGTPVRGHLSKTRKLDPATGEWHTEKLLHDKFGNTVRSWDVSGDESRYTEIGYSAAYAFAYPVSVSLPAADPSGLRGTSERSKTLKTYDRVTGLLLSVTDLQLLGNESDDRTTVTEYADPLLRVTSVRESGGAIREYLYTDGPGVSRVRTRELLDLGKWRDAETEYDGFGREVISRSFHSEGVSVSETLYDLHGRVVSRSAPYFEGTSPNGIARFRTEYDTRGRIIRRYSEIPNGGEEATAEFEYGISSAQGAAGRFVVTRDGSGRAKREIKGSFGQTIRADEAVAFTGHTDVDLGPVHSPARPTSYVYGKRGDLVEIRQGVQRRYFARDAFGRLIFQKLPEQEPNPGIRYTDPDTGNSSWSAAFVYDPMGNLVRAESANGVVTESEYDALDRLVSRSWSDGTPPVLFKYDLVANGKGEVIEVSNAISVTRIPAFDAAGRPSAYEQVTAGKLFKSGVEYDLSGDIKRSTYPSGKVLEFDRGADGRLRRVGGTSGAAEAVYANSFVYGPRGKTRSMRLGNGRFESADFHASGRLESISLGASADDSGIWSVDYVYGEANADGSLDNSLVNGSVAELTTHGAGEDPFVQRFRYDPVGRLFAAHEGNGSDVNWSQEFGYDRFGNRTLIIQDVEGAQTSVVSEFDQASNRFMTGSGFVYDRNGNVVREPSGRSFVLDARNKQTEVRSADGLLVARYFYDGNGRRVMTETPLETTVFVYAGDKLVAEYSTNPPRDPKTRYLTQDHLGSTRVITDSGGSVLARKDHMPFGEELVSGVGERTAASGYSSATSRLRPGFAGLQTDPETGLSYAEARVYDSRYGRFTAVDPMLESADASDPRTLNRYVYTLNDPVNLTDPDGLSVVDDWYVSDDGKIEVYRTEDPFDRFYVFDENRNVFVMVAQLQKNSYGLVRFPNTGWGYTYYNPGERGGYDPETNEHVGQGDHYLLPVTAAALFGFTNQLKNDFGITLALGDMSSSNGSDPWDSRFRSESWNGHHATHGHKGNGTGQSIDFRYVDGNGQSRQGNWVTNPGRFSVYKNQAVFDLAKKWGFGKSLRGYSAPIRGTRAASLHNDHGHLGFDLSKKKPKRIFQDRRRYYIRWSDVTLDCLVDQCH